MTKIKGYSPPKPGDICYIRKSYKEWSSNTLVTVTSHMKFDEVEVIHEPTQKAFSIPVDFLTKARKRY